MFLTYPTFPFEQRALSFITQSRLDPVARLMNATSAPSVCAMSDNGDDRRGRTSEGDCIMETRPPLALPSLPRVGRRSHLSCHPPVSRSALPPSQSRPFCLRLLFHVSCTGLCTNDIYNIWNLGHCQVSAHPALCLHMTFFPVRS